MDYREQHKLRLAYMPWLYHRLKPAHAEWARAWQTELQAELAELETVEFGKNVFIAPQARLFAEPGRPIIIGDGSTIAADSVLHGPIRLGCNVSINHHATLDGGRKGITVGNDTRIAAHATLFAFNHGMAAGSLIREQAVDSEGITIGQDVWIGAQAGIVDGVCVGDGAVIGMNSQVTQNVAAQTVVAGNPAREIKKRSP